jgi:hypothetical protein
MSQPKIKRSALREVKNLKQRLRAGGAFVTLVVSDGGKVGAVCADRMRAVQFRVETPEHVDSELIDMEVIR